MFSTMGKFVVTQYQQPGLARGAGSRAPRRPPRPTVPAPPPAPSAPSRRPAPRTPRPSPAPPVETRDSTDSHLSIIITSLSSVFD